MQVLQWALDHPQDLRHAVIIAASSRLTAQNIAFSAVAREAILRDPGFASGRYGETGSVPSTGLSIARMMAHITYLSEEAMSEKFGRRFQSPGRTGGGFGIDFAVESYLAHQATSFLNRFDALSYLYLSRVMDYFDPFATEGGCPGRRGRYGLLRHLLRLRLALRHRALTADRRPVARQRCLGHLPGDPLTVGT